MDATECLYRRLSERPNGGFLGYVATDANTALVRRRADFVGESRCGIGVQIRDHHIGIELRQRPTEMASQYAQTARYDGRLAAEVE